MNCPNCKQPALRERFKASSPFAVPLVVGAIGRCQNGHVFGFKREALSEQEWANCYDMQFRQDMNYLRSTPSQKSKNK